MKAKGQKKMKNSRLLKPLLFIASFVCLSFAATLLMSGGKVAAVPGDATNVLPADGTNIVVSADTCGQCFYSPNSINYLYVPVTSATASVTLTTNRTELSSFNIGSVVVGSPNSCDPLVRYNNPTNTPDATIFNPRNNARIAILTNQQANQRTITGNGVTYKVFCVQVQTNTGSNVTFRLATEAGNLLGAYPGPLANKGTGYFANNGAKWSELVSFAPACGDTTTSGNIVLFDLDNGYSQTPNIRVYLTRYNKDGTGAIAMGLGGDVQGPVDGFGGRETVTGSNGYSWNIVNTTGYSDAYKYSLQVTGIGAQNKIRVRLPFDQVYSAFSGQCSTPPSGSITSANCSVITGSLVDRDHTGPYRIDIHFRDGPPSSGYTNTYTTFTDSSNNFVYAVPASFKNYNGGASTRVWVDGLGKAPDGSNQDWVALSGSPQTIGPCITSACDLISYDSGAGFRTIPNNGAITVTAGQSLTVRTAWRNNAPVGGTTWTNVGGNSASAYDAGWDTTVPAPVNSSGGYNSAPNARLRAENRGSTVGLGGTAAFFWDVGVVTRTGNFTQTFRMVRENPNGEWFGGACTFGLNVQFTPPIAGTDISCTMGSAATDFSEVGESFNGSYTVTYRPTGNPAFYSSVNISNPTFSVTPGYPSRTGTPANFTLPPQSTGAAQTVNFSPPAYVLASPGLYALNGAFTVTAPDGAGGTRTFVVRCSDTKSVGTRPYLRVYGGDVIAGAGFSQDCLAPPANILTYARPNGANWVGAGAQLAAFANGSITGFVTASLFAPAAPSTLAFANTPATTPPVMGGSFNSRFCATDYWPDTLPVVGPSVLTPASSGRIQLPNNATLTQAGALTTSVTIYVDGNLTIDSNIVVSGGPWASPQAIPTLYVIVRGNIYIKPGVTQLDGMYIAQPRTLTPTITEGRIFTCYNTTNANTDSTFIAQNCTRKLTINGAFLAAKVNFLRVNGTASSAPVAEQSSSANIAETIQFIPELLLSTPDFGANTTSGRYDSITSLSPSL